MSRERELLEKILPNCLDFLYDLQGAWDWKKDERAGNAKEYDGLVALISDIQELIAQLTINYWEPEQEPLSDESIAEQAVWAANTKHSFKEGVRWAEKMHGIGGGNEHS